MAETGRFEFHDIYVILNPVLFYFSLINPKVNIAFCAKGAFPGEQDQ